jgi:AAA+ superfamily predicted ATPase
MESESSSKHLDASEAIYAGLLSLLQKLDQRIAAAVSASEKVYASRAAGDLYRGLVIAPEDVAAALDCVPGEPFHAISSQLPVISGLLPSLVLQRLRWLQQAFDLSDFDLDVIVIALAPEIDLRYERLYIYLHDDVTKRRPTVDLALNILCSDGAGKLLQRQRFSPEAPLLRHRLIRFVDDEQSARSPLLAQSWRLDEQIARILLDDGTLDSRLISFCSITTVISPDERPPLADEIEKRLSAVTGNKSRAGIKLCFLGPRHCGQDAAVAQLSERLDSSVLMADFSHAGADHAVFGAETLLTIVREAWFRDALLVIRGFDLADEAIAANHFRLLWRLLDSLPVNCVVESEFGRALTGEPPRELLTLRFSYPSAENRMAWWRYWLTQYEIAIKEESVAELARCYRMSYRQIENSVAEVAMTGAPAGAVSGDAAVSNAIAEAARRQFSHALLSLTSRIEPSATWDDLVLPDDEIAQLHALCHRFRHRDKVFGEWGYARKLSYGLGITALFSGGSGTGKTMAAEVVANALGLELYRIDLPQVVSKYIGETEKNLDRIFNAAENANAILFFDEADALFGKRSEVRDSHDRYANLEISFLLQKMEQYEGITILATNLNDNIDKAFARRLALSIHFPFPDEFARLRLWQLAWPESVPLALSVDREVLARELKIAGGNIRNIALGAAFNAAGNGGVVDMAHVLEAARREYRKLGKSFAEQNMTMLDHDR